MPEVSIIIPVYNNSTLILDAINSIINQSFKDLEVIIIDDGSVDNTVNVIENYINKNCLSNFYLYKKENGGPSSARNYGIENSRGKYIMFLDSDDLYDEQMVSELYKCVENKSEKTLALCGIKKISKNSITNYEMKECIIQGKIALAETLEMLQYNQIFNSSCNKIFNKKILDKNKILFDEELEMGEDFKFNLEYYSKIEQLVVISKSLYNYRVDNSYVSNSIRKNDFNKRKNNIEVLKVYYNDLGIEKNIDFQYIKIFYSEIFNELERKKKGINIKEDDDNLRSIIKDLLARKEIIEIRNSYKPDKLYKFLLYIPIKVESVSLIYLASITMNKLRKKKISKRKGISI